MTAFRILAGVITIAAIVSAGVMRSSAGAGQVKEAATVAAGQAMAVLSRHCSKCHGDSSAPNLNLLNLNGRAGMIQRRQIVPGDPDHSRIYIRAALSPRDPMPPRSTQDTLTESEKESIKTWIASGAAAVGDHNRSADRGARFITEADVLKDIESDLASVPVSSRSFMRYFLLTHLANSGSSDADLQLYRSAFSRLINSLSWTRAVAVPRTVDRAGTIQRIDLRDYSWTPAAWQRLLTGYPYAVTSSSKTAQAIYQQTQCELPYIRTDWFIANAALPPLYHDLLGLPLTAQELESQLNIDLAKDLRLKSVRRSGFSESGVSRNNRVVERHDTAYGAYWRSYDFAANSGKQNIFENPLTFEEAGGEIIFNLPNGLQAYMLVNGAGRRIDTAPIEIVSNKEDPHDPVVRNGLTCMSCHAQGMKHFDERADQLRQVILARSDEQNAATRSAALALYTDKPEIVSLLNADAARFEHAVAATGSEFEHEDPVVVLAKLFNQSLTVGQAAAELGVTESVFQSKLNASPDLGTLRGLLAAAGGVIKRDAWEEYFSIAVQEAARGGYNRPSSFAAVKQFSFQRNGVTYVTSGPPEILTATFKQADGGVTVGSYSGLVVVNVTGVGQAESNAYNDAFYRYDGVDAASPRIDTYMDQLVFGTTPLEPSPANNATRRIVSGIPAYNPAHNYTFVLDTGLSAPGKLHFGVGDRGFDDNTGAYTIQVAQLRALR